MVVVDVQVGGVGGWNSADRAAAALLREHACVIIDADAELATQMRITIGTLAVWACSVLAAISVDVLCVSLLPPLDTSDVRSRVLRVLRRASCKVANFALRPPSVGTEFARVEVVERFQLPALLAAFHPGIVRQR